MGKTDSQRITLAGLVITLGIVYGDIGTSPLYTIKAIMNGASGQINELLVYGSLSLVFWTLTLQTTIKYVWIMLNADNKGEGGILALFALLRRKTPAVAVLTMIGGATLLSDGVITPAITVTSSVEGLRLLNPGIPVIPIVLMIFAVLFFMQQFGTKFMGSSFGPVMVIWFMMLAATGLSRIIQYPDVLKALSPHYGLRFLGEYPGGFILLGAVFLCTTGAEALYSDLGHVGKTNIRISWIFVKICLVLNYFGQGSWLITEYKPEMVSNPFFSIMPGWFLIPGIIISTAAAVIASQALITGSYTLVSEAVSLNFWPKIKILNPTTVRGQVYLPVVNWSLWIMCSLVVLFFRSSSNMEAAYGLAITITMIISTFLLALYLYQRRTHASLIVLLLVTYLTLQGSFLIANLHKFRYGGWFTLVLAFLFFVIMFGWYFGRKIKNRYITFSNLNKYKDLFRDLRNDTSVPRTATNLVYVIKANRQEQVESKVLYSIFNKQPKRADTYWLLHVDRVDEPYRFEYEVSQIIPGILIRVDFHIGFKIDPRINLYFREVLEDLVRSGEIRLESSYVSMKKHGFPGDFKFVFIERIIPRDYSLGRTRNIILSLHRFLRFIGIPDEKELKLDLTNTIVEQVPIIIDQPLEKRINRTFPKTWRNFSSQAL